MPVQTPELPKLKLPETKPDTVEIILNPETKPDTVERILNLDEETFRKLFNMQKVESEDQE
jgi:hypothetical protein